MVMRRADFRPPIPQRELDHMIDLAEIDATDAVVNPCSGDGYLAVAAARKAKSVLAIDIDVSPLNYEARMVLGNLRLLGADVLRLNRKDLWKSHDVALMVVPVEGGDQIKLVKQAVRLLKNNGRLVILGSERLSDWIQSSPAPFDHDQGDVASEIQMPQVYPVRFDGNYSAAAIVSGFVLHRS
jgi:ubiquinone/menaquinone biosynthesis C-methylase UbiE